MNITMAEKMNISLPAKPNIYEFAENGYSEVVNISLENNATKNYVCHLCDYKGKDKGGMTKHIRSKHRAVGKKQKRDDTLDDGLEEKKLKADVNVFHPEASSTQVSAVELPKNRTASELSNESLVNFLNDKFDFSHNLGTNDDDKSVLDEAEKTEVEDDKINKVRIPRADIALLNIRLGKLEEEIKVKALECIEKEGAIENLENENDTLKEELEKKKDEIGVKNVVIEGNVARINTLEEELRRKNEELRRKNERIDILEPAVNRILKNEVRQVENSDPTDLKKLKSELKSKNLTIKQLKEHKSELANELKELQEKTHEENNTDKCIQLTANVNALKVENKALEKEKKKLNELSANLQTKLNELNNKLTEYQVSNVRLKEHNSQLSELVKSSKITETLKEDHSKDKAEQEIVQLDTDMKSTATKPSPRSGTKSVKKCRFFEKGFCRKNPCNFYHPSEVCINFSKYGRCSYGQNCRLRHPVNVCMNYLEGRCNSGFSCINQHPQNISPVYSPGYQPSTLPYPPLDHPILPYPTAPQSAPYSPPRNQAQEAPFANYRSPAAVDHHISPGGSSSVPRSQYFW